MVVFFPGTCKNRSSRTGEILSMMSNPNCIPLNRIVINSRYAQLIQDMLDLMEFLNIDICKSSSITKRINLVIILSGMGCGMSSTCHNITTNKRSSIYIYIYYYLIPLGFMKFHVNTFKKGSKVDQYMFQNHKWSVVYLWCNI